ncbi:hypothetical protein O6B42_07290 [Campylobacter ureolyticus]|uniref:hypothetical protein n=1 Tax=Campylobacter ureolyticus TaxID=827 RepID=UPI0022B44633|nr:hypothetical protein [Campylobacter ureolyticus]MCZ6133670.1 hypothetical protein [Campylobacter ureolyticus]
MLKDEFLKKLDELGLSISDFANLTKLNIGSVYSWNDTNRKIPAWVAPFLNHYEKSKNFDELMQIIEKYKSQNDK